MGRDPERRAAREAFAGGAHLVSLVGLGGVGKTTLARHLAEELHGGFLPVTWVDASALVRAPQLVLSVLKAVGGVLDFDTDPLEILAVQAGSRAHLLVLDNLEQVRGAAGAVSDLRRAAPGLRFLVTSRWPLGLREERLVPVRAFPTPRDGISGASPSTRAPSTWRMPRRCCRRRRRRKLPARSCASPGVV